MCTQGPVYSRLLFVWVLAHGHFTKTSSVCEHVTGSMKSLEIMLFLYTVLHFMIQNDTLTQTSFVI